MKEPKRVPEREAEAKRITKHITRFFNVAYGRNTTGSRELIDAVYSALEDRYSEDEIRVAYWAARCVTGKASWLGERLRAGDVLPPMVLRHHGGINNQTGKPAVRWLDEMIARALESNPVLVKALLDSLPEDMRPGEEELLKRMGMRIGV
jgi:hypothetical protein